jgi:Flp pilus assembly protein TadD
LRQARAIAWEAGQRDEVVGWYERALLAEPLDTDLQSGLVACLQRTGRAADARAAHAHHRRRAVAQAIT